MKRSTLPRPLTSPFRSRAKPAIKPAARRSRPRSRKTPHRDAKYRAVRSFLRNRGALVLDVPPGHPFDLVAFEPDGTVRFVRILRRGQDQMRLAQGLSDLGHNGQVMRCSCELWTAVSASSRSARCLFEGAPAPEGKTARAA